MSKSENEMLKFLPIDPEQVKWDQAFGLALRGDAEFSAFVKQLPEKHPRQLSDDPDVQNVLDEARLVAFITDLIAFVKRRRK